MLCLRRAVHRRMNTHTHTPSSIVYFPFPFYSNLFFILFILCHRFRFSFLICVSHLAATTATEAEEAVRRRLAGLGMLFMSRSHE